MDIKASATITLSSVVDVWSTTRYYLLQSSTQAAPAKPTTNPPTGGWNDTEPTYTSGSTNTLYFTDLTVFSDGSWAYSLVSVSSAYEAAKAAWNKAQAAQNAVTALDNALTQQEIFDRLTDGGAAQGLVLYNGQLYVNASYINAGTLNAALANVININADNITAGSLSVDRINFNDPEGHYSVPNENDPSSLFPNTEISNGWIVSTRPTEDMVLLKCDYAVPLRGKTVTFSFEYKTRCGDCASRVTIINSEAYAEYQIDDWFPTSEPPYVPPNPYTYRYTVPSDAYGFEFFVTGCDGVKNITASVSGTVITPPTIKIDYAGITIGDLLITRDGDLITSGKSVFSGPASFLGTPLSIYSGGTGASTAAAARANLNIRSGTKVPMFTDGIVTYQFSDFGVTARPTTIVITPQSEMLLIQYDWDNSSSNIVLRARKLDNTLKTGLVRFSYIAIP